WLGRPDLLHRHKQPENHGRRPVDRRRRRSPPVRRHQGAVPRRLSRRPDRRCRRPRLDRPLPRRPGRALLARRKARRHGDDARPRHHQDGARRQGPEDRLRHYRHQEHGRGRVQAIPSRRQPAELRLPRRRRGTDQGKTRMRQSLGSIDPYPSPLEGGGREGGAPTLAPTRGAAALPHPLPLPAGEGRSWTRAIALLLAGVIAPATALAAPEFAPVWTDQAVIQRDQPITVQGTAAPSATVEVTLGTQTQSARTDANGRFSAEFAARPASDLPLTLTATDSTGTATVSDLLVGDIWLCSGQSNMEFP